MAEHYKGHRASSRKAKIREKYDEAGQDEALSLGAELGLAIGTIKSWIGAWKKGSSPPTEKKKTETGNKYPPVKLDKVLSTEHRAVFLKPHRDYKGIVIEAGPEQSIVKWSNGNRTVACNSWLEDDL